MNLKKYGAKTVAYKDLPRTHQMAIAWYMAIDGEAWETYGINMDKQPTTLSSDKNKDKWEVYLKKQTSRHLSSYVKEYGHCKFGVVEIPTEVVIKKVMNTVEVDFESVDGFRKHCSEMLSAPHYPSKNRWPCILADDNYNVLQDGWHRFHSYVRADHKTIPCIYYLKKEKYFQKQLDIH